MRGLRLVSTWAFVLSLAAGASLPSNVQGQDVKVPEVEQTSGARRGTSLRRMELAPLLRGDIVPLWLRGRDTAPVVQLVQNEPGGAPAPAAVAPTQGEVIVLLGSATGRSVDARVRRLAAVRHPPLSLYPNIRVLAWNRYTFRTTPTSVTLPNGRRLSISLTQILPNGRFVVQTVVSPRAGQSGPPTTATIEAAPGEPFFFAGHTHEGGTLMIGISVGAAPPRP